VLIFLSTAATGNTQPSPLTLEEAIRVALSGHPELAASGQEVTGARAGIQGARALPSPEITVIPSGLIDDAQAVFLQPLEITGQRSARTAAARARLSAAEARREALRLEIVFRVRTAFYDALAAQQEREVVSQTVELLDRLYQAAQRSLELGRTPGTHVMRMRIEATRARQELRLVEGEVVALKAALNVAMGRDAAMPVMLQGDLPRPVEAVKPETARATAWRQRPELAAAKAEVRAREAEERAARAGLRPDVVLEARRASLRRAEGTAGIGLTLPFLDWGRRRAEIRQAQSAAQAQRAVLRQQENVVTLDVEESLARLQAAAQVAQSYEAGILADAEQLVRKTSIGYQEGALSYLEVLDAQRTLLETRRAAIQAVNAYSKARAALDRAMGSPVPIVRSESGRAK